MSLVRDPGSSFLSEKIRSILLDKRHRGMTPVTELLLYEAARSQLVAEIIHPAMERGEIVISDRFSDSTVAYQQYGRLLSPSLIQYLNQQVSGGIVPQRTYILDIPWEESLRRRTDLKPVDRMENEEKNFYQRVREGYLEIAREEPQRVRLMDGTKSIEILEQEILQDTLTMIEQLQIKKVGEKAK